MSRWEPVLTDLVQYRGGSLLRYATLLCGDQREAEDLVQDALIKVFSLRRPLGASQDESGAMDHAEAYVRRTILHVYIDGYRRRLRWVALRHLVSAETRTAGPDQGGPERLDLESALAALPPKQRACVVLRFYADLSVRQIADDLGVTSGTVKRHLHDANAKLALSLSSPMEAELP